MRAHENPFRNSRVEALRFRGDISVPVLVGDLARSRYRGAIVGPEGSGKSTLLRELGDALSDAGIPTLSLRREEWAEALSGRMSGSCVLLDGAEKIAGPVLVGLLAFLPRVVVTAHRKPLGVPVLLRCRTSIGLLDQLLAELGLATAASGPARRFFDMNRGDLRLVFAALYDLTADEGAASRGRDRPHRFTDGGSR